MLALIAGQGALPKLVHDAAGGGVFVAALEGFPPRDIPHHRTFRIEELGSFIADLVARGVTEVCFAGAIRRPPLDPSRIDAATMPLVPRMMAALQSGDDAALRTVIAFFEEAGLKVRAAHEIAPGLLAEPGVLSAHGPDEAARADLGRAREVVRAMGAADLGQGCIVCKGQVLAVEAVMGTDWMVRAVSLFRMATPGVAVAQGSLRAVPGVAALAGAASALSGVPLVDGMGFPPELARGGLLYKAPKPGQDRRIDLPAIGPETVRAAAGCGLDGIAIAAGGVMILDRDETLAEADRLGLFLWAVE